MCVCHKLKYSAITALLFSFSVSLGLNYMKCLSLSSLIPQWDILTSYTGTNCGHHLLNMSFKTLYLYLCNYNSGRFLVLYRFLHLSVFSIQFFLSTVLPLFVTSYMPLIICILCITNRWVRRKRKWIRSMSIQMISDQMSIKTIEKVRATFIPSMITICSIQMID